jgi:predicted nucleotidyltransferase
MDDIKDRLGDYKYNFFTTLQNYIDSELLFFGSIKRFDFFPNSSDIDIIIITDNVDETIKRVRDYLQLNKTEIKKIYQRFSNNSVRLITGYKIKYTDPSNDCTFDLLIYDEKYREAVTQNIDDINNMALYMVAILYIMKYVYYRLKLMTNSMYLYLKNGLFHMYFTGTLLYKREFAQTIIVDNS